MVAEKYIIYYKKEKLTLTILHYSYSNDRYYIEDNKGNFGSSLLGKEQALYNYNRNIKNKIKGSELYGK